MASRGHLEAIKEDIAVALKAPKPRYLVDESGKKSAVVLSVDDYSRLLEAWEEVADAEDFDAARKSAKDFVPAHSLRGQVFRGR